MLGCWDRRETGVDSARSLLGARPVRHRLGTAGRPRSERLMCLPRRMCPLGKGTCGLALLRLLSRNGPGECDRRAPLTLLRSVLRDVDLIAHGPTRTAANQLEIRRVPAALSREVRPLAGSLHRRGRPQSDGPGERT
jgi:hypothetical protein